ncbi:phosphate-selective porin [Prosthecobacter fusiformis]|uniref:Phosphate-selective porin n=1 Tax=Prosthecobacter fusiformis TaxID=48464 RepID=A0A4R7STR3_9BACT|nr:porin [Prosthecobacter fusiformis]TDU81687.1 phosphate-selective porin [Prosthecobacter fusiformis]
MSLRNRTHTPILSKLSQSLRALLFVCTLGSLALPSQILADNAALMKLFEIMKAKGSITQEEYDQLVAVAQAEEAEAASAPPVVAVAPVAAPSMDRVEQIEDRISETEAELKALDAHIAESRKSLADLDKLSAETPKDLMEKMLDGKWYENLGIRGYVQFRYHALYGENAKGLNVPNDRSVSDTESFMIRRGRLIISGDVSDHLYIYAQSDYNASNGSGDYVLQMRDLYADISLDSDKEFRFRIGQSKVPFGFVNLQSSQNRAALERPDALNSAVEGERDVGAYFYWAPKEKRKLFSKLVKEGLKGSGDYGVFGIGAYNGQGLNRSDTNGQPHYVARFAYPVEFKSGQIMEFGLQGYTGSFVSRVSAIPGVGTPSSPDHGNKDERVGLSYILYPQPFGIEAEWTWGRGPQLTEDMTAIETDSLQGGYIQASYRIQDGQSNWLPFVRYNHYDGGRKFGTNSPWDKVSELDIGLEWSPRPEIELALMYTHTFHRTNTAAAPYAEVENADRLGLQLQWNF